ncbi:MAG: hypothetical protein WDZ49_02530, partial [Litorilinea sp.]
MTNHPPADDFATPNHASPIRPVAQIQVRALRFADDGAIPNHPRLPLLVYGGALRLRDEDSAAQSAAQCEAVFGRAGW